jgi:hypothetical protein
MSRFVQAWVKLRPGLLMAPTGLLSDPRNVDQDQAPLPPTLLRSCRELLAADNMLRGVDGTYSVAHPLLPGQTLEVR